MDETHGTSLQRDVEVAQAAGIIALGNIASRLLGLVREMVKSGLFGAGPHVDALNAALRVPNTLYDLVVGGMTSSVLIPVLSDYAVPERRAELWHLLSVLISIASLVMCGFVLLGELLAPQLVGLLVEGLSSPYQALATDLLRVVLPAIIFLSLASILSGGLYALKQFTFPAFTVAIFNAGVVVVALALGRRWGVHSMAAGLLVGAVLQVALQLPGLRGARLRFALDLRHPALRRIVRLYLPILIGLAVDTLAVFLSYNLASRTGEGSISWMEYAATIIQFPLGLVVTAISIAILPTLSRQASAEEIGPFRATLAQGLRLVLVLIIPATIGLYVLATPIVAVIFEHGGFKPADTVATAEALRCALLGLLFAAVDQPLIFAFYAHKDTLTPALVGVGTTLLYVLMALIPWWLGVLTLPLLVLVNSLKLTAHAVAMLWLTRRRLGGLGDHRLWSLTGKATLASLVMAAVTGGIMRALAAAVSPGLPGELLAVGAAGGVGVVIYGLLALALRLEEIHLIRAAFNDGLNRLTRAGR
ncbi:MAG TPA: murein biosynthesis integral membrane protein MurJ [Anaerolineae bacterium]|nr:murein biosynthesis integral membrane protein MurJ [Anaerolineae bacterium]